MSNLELKWFDHGEGLTELSNSALTYSTAMIPSAPSASEEGYLGRGYRIVRILWRIALVLPPTSDDAKTSDLVRILLFVDRQNNSDLQPDIGPDIDLLLESGSSNGWLAFYKMAEQGRFEILFDKSIALDDSMGSTTGAQLTGSHHEFEVGEMFVDIPVLSAANTEVRGNVVYLAATRIGTAAFWQPSTRVEFIRL